MLRINEYFYWGIERSEEHREAIKRSNPLEIKGDNSFSVENMIFSTANLQKLHRSYECPLYKHIGSSFFESRVLSYEFRRVANTSFEPWQKYWSKYSAQKFCNLSNSIWIYHFDIDQLWQTFSISFVFFLLSKPFFLCLDCIVFAYDVD